ncbi:MAG: hypothetical protein V4594_01515 [Bacteroidota bacterium]
MKYSTLNYSLAVVMLLSLSCNESSNRDDKVDFKAVSKSFVLELPKLHLPYSGICGQPVKPSLYAGIKQIADSLPGDLSFVSIVRVANTRQFIVDNNGRIKPSISSK